MREVVVVTLLILTNSTLGLAQPPPERWHLVPELRIGSAHDERSALTSVTAILEAPDGSIFVAQPNDQRILHFGAGGELLRSIGRKGAGPGEFEALVRIGWRGDTLWASDLKNRRVTLFSRAGALLGTIPVDAPADVLYLGPDGALGAVPGTPAAAESTGVVRLSRQGRHLGNVVRFPSGSARADVRATGAASLTFMQPFADRPLFRAAPDGGALIVIERPSAAGPGAASFTVRKFDAATGRERYARSHPYVPVPLPGDTVEQVVDSLVTVAASLGYAGWRSPANRQRIRAALQVPAFYAPVADAFVAGDGSVWLRRATADRRRSTWLVLDRDGRGRAEAVAPAGARLLAANGDAVWGAVEDDLGVPYVVRFRIRREGAGVSRP
jgi:hypothetical protein